MQLQKVQNKTKNLSFWLYAFVRQKNKNNKPHKDIHIYKREIQTIKKMFFFFKYIYMYIVQPPLVRSWSPVIFGPRWPAILDGGLPFPTPEAANSYTDVC